MNQKQFQIYLKRDDGCVHCGETEAVSPHHRRNRGMGGSKERDVPSNIIVICSWLNNAMESDDVVANLARHYGWKLRAGDVPRETPIWHYRGEYRILDDDYGFVVTSEPEDGH